MNGIQQRNQEDGDTNNFADDSQQLPQQERVRTSDNEPIQEKPRNRRIKGLKAVGAK